MLQTTQLYSDYSKLNSLKTDLNNDTEFLSANSQKTTATIKRRLNNTNFK